MDHNQNTISVKKLTFSDKVTLWRLIQQLTLSNKNESKLTKIHLDAIKIFFGYPDTIDEWLKHNSQENIRKLNYVVKRLNQYIHMQKKAEKKILSAGSQLNSNFQNAEKEAKEAIRLASGNPELYDQYERDITNYFATTEAQMINIRKKSGDPVDHKKEILDKQQFIREAKNMVNTMANNLMLTSPTFKYNRIEFIKKELEGPKYQAKFLDRDGQMQYRAIRPDGDYGKPEIAFKEGLAPQFVSTWAFQSGVISKPYVNDVFETIGEKIGWTGGITSTSANLKFCAAFDFAASYGIQDGFIYVYACNEAASVARHITFGVGYDGKVSQGEGTERSNAEAAMEYMIPYMEPTRIVGVREIKKDGTLGNYIFNRFCNHSAFGDGEFLKLILCNNVDEIKLIEFLERRSPEILNQVNNVEYVNKMVNLFISLPLARQSLILQLAHSDQNALHFQLQNNTNLNTTSAHKLSILHDLKLPNFNHKDPMEMLPMSIKSALGKERYAMLEQEMGKISDKNLNIYLKSHFGLEFEGDKRIEKNKDELTSFNTPSKRYM